MPSPSPGLELMPCGHSWSVPWELPKGGMVPFSPLCFFRPCFWPCRGGHPSHSSELVHRFALGVPGRSPGSQEASTPPCTQLLFSGGQMALNCDPHRALTNPLLPGSVFPFPRRCARQRRGRPHLLQGTSWGSLSGSAKDAGSRLFQLNSSHPGLLLSMITDAGHLRGPLPVPGQDRVGPGYSLAAAPELDHRARAPVTPHPVAQGGPGGQEVKGTQNHLASVS